MTRATLNNERGVAAIIALIMVGMLTLLGIAALSTSDDEMTIAGNQLQEMRSFYAAEAGLEAATANLQNHWDSTNAPPSVMPSGIDSLNGSIVAWRVTDDGAPQQRALSQGTLAGLNAQVKSYTVTAASINTLDHATVKVSQNFEVATIPIFQFAVFYGNDLEIAPGPDMNLVGRVHSNGNLWLQAGNSLRMESFVTASGEILHGRKGPGSVASGDVLIKDGSGNYVNMNSGGNWLDHNDSNWYEESINRWDGRVQDGAHGQSELNLPLAASGDPHDIIERYNGGANPESYERKASVRIINGTVEQQVGSVWIDVTATWVANGVIDYVPNQFTDQREGTDVETTNLNVRQMYDLGLAPDNGVLYFADDASAGEFPALRLTNGEELGGDLTVVSQNPLYTVGDYNSVDKKAAALMADAVTFLSSAWDDTQSNQNKSNRPADETTVNASYLTGNVETTHSNYNGGFENLPRFLEVWSGVNFNWSGSAVNLWNAEQATGNWSGSYYSPPNRNWSYDTDLDDPANHPPATPLVRVFQRVGWQQDYVGYADEAATGYVEDDISVTF